MKKGITFRSLEKSSKVEIVNMRLVFTSVLLLFMANMAWAQQYMDPYLTDETRPNGTKWLPDPPSMTGGDFANDFYYYQWGKTQREGETGAQALWDESAPIHEAFSDAMGITLSPEETPEIMKLVGSCLTDIYLANKVVKGTYQRTRPFAQFNEPSLRPETDEVESKTFSYPSGHALRGWMFALVCTTIAPERTEPLLNRAYQYAINRVICGHHWKSDIDAAVMMTAGVFANLVVTDAYQQQLVKARAEYQSIVNNVETVSAPVSTASDKAAIYDLQGRKLKSKPTTPGVYINNGKKIVAH